MGDAADVVVVTMRAYYVVLAEAIGVEGLVVVGFNWVVLDVLAEMDVLIFDLVRLSFVWISPNGFDESERCICLTLEDALHFVVETK